MAKHLVVALATTLALAGTLAAATETDLGGRLIPFLGKTDLRGRFTAQGAGASAQVSFPKPTATTPSGCLDEVRAYGAAQEKEVPPANDPARAMTPQARSALWQQIYASRAAMAKACVAQFDAKTIAEDLPNLAALYIEAGLLDQAQVAVDRALRLKTMAPADRAAFLVSALSIVNRTPTPEGEARPWRVAHVYPRLDAIVDELDGLSAATFDQKFIVHQSMLSSFRTNDFDAGIIKHATWFQNAAKTMTPEQRTKAASSRLASYVDMAEVWAGQGLNDEAIGLLKRGLTDLADVPAAKISIQPEIDRLMLVGTPGAALHAPVWLNAPAGTKALAMPGAVTLLEFTAHWCGPCRESYPGINRLRERFKGQNFRVVMVTRVWGYFGSERNIAADVEIAHDKDYFAEHGLDVPVAIGGPLSARTVDGKTQYGPDPNDAAYRVGGIPQIHLIDKQGKIRLLMVGYDNTNEETLARMIETMLK